MTGQSISERFPTIINAEEIAETALGSVSGWDEDNIIEISMDVNSRHANPKQVVYTVKLMAVIDNEIFEDEILVFESLDGTRLITADGYHLY